MNSMKNTYVTLKTEKFNVSESKEYFINENCFGDDFGKWLLSKLSARRVEFEEDGPDQEDFGWYINFSISGSEITCLIIYNETDLVWQLVLEHNVGLIGSIMGKRNKKIDSNAVKLLDEILISESEFYSIEWHNFRHQQANQ